MAEAKSSYVLKDKNDPEEVQRLNRQYEFIKIFTNAEILHPSVPLAGVKNIADVATGSGIWLQELERQLQNDSISYTGFDMTLSQTPTSHPKNMKFIQHNILVPFEEHYLGTFDIVHVRLLVGALKKVEIPIAVENIIQLLKPGGYLQWDDIESTTMRAVPQNDFADAIYRDVFQFGTMLGFDLHLPSTLEELCKSIGMEEVEVFVDDSLATAGMVAKTREIACLWYVDAMEALMPGLLPVLKGMTKEEGLVKRDEIIETLRRIYEGGVTPGVTLTRIVARKQSA